ILFVCLALASATLIVFWPVTGYQFVNFDDPDYVTANAQVQAGVTAGNVSWAFTTNHARNWHPLTWLSHMLDCQMYGLNPAGHHITNLILHTANSVLLFLALHRMTSKPWKPRMNTDPARR